ncbi:hypothetical protein ABFX02_12G038500 [Erythranthe guttata]
MEPNELPPLVRALKASADRKPAAFHFPGHKRGEAAPSALSELIGKDPYLHDVTELPDLDRFFNPKGPLLEAKNLAAELFGAKETWFLVGGTSCGVQAAVMATCSPGDTIILPRNAHVSTSTGVIVSGALPKYIVPKHNSDWDVAAGITPLQVELAIKESKNEGRKLAAVLITSPTYEGICSNLREISEICHSHGIPLIVDEAHGAHLKFHPDMPETALEQGADISIQSTHKVLCSLSQSSMIHISGSELIDRVRLHKCLHFLQTTSPSWLLLASLDAARHQISTNKDTIFNTTVELANEAKFKINNIPGISVLDVSDFPDFPDRDPLRFAIGVWGIGLSGYRASQLLDDKFGIVSELSSTQSFTVAFSLGTTAEHAERLVSGLNYLSSAGTLKYENIPPDQTVSSRKAPYENSVMSLSPRDAFFAEKTTVKFEDSAGEVCGEFICPYPPGIPVLLPGELITEKAVNYLQQIKNLGGFITGPADPLLESIVVCAREK